VMENGDVHLCWGGPIGNLLSQPLEEIFASDLYQERLLQYRQCRGCWTTCYTQRHLLLHPRSFDEFRDNLIKMVHLRRFQQEALQ